MPRRNGNVSQTRDHHRMSLAGVDGLPLRIPGRRIRVKARRKGWAA
ncbi:hypothetical protein [Streptomyces sp. 4N124]